MMGEEFNTSSLGFIIYIISGWDSVYEMIGESTVTLSLMMGEKFYKILRSFDLIPEFEGRTFKDVKEFLGLIIRACSLPIDRYDVQIKGRVLEANFHTPLPMDNEYMKKLTSFFGWKNMVSILIGCAVYLLSKMLGRKVLVAGFKSDFKDNEWKTLTYLKTSD